MHIIKMVYFFLIVSSDEALQSVNNWNVEAVVLPGCFAALLVLSYRRFSNNLLLLQRSCCLNRLFETCSVVSVWGIVRTMIGVWELWGNQSGCWARSSAVTWLGRTYGKVAKNIAWLVACCHFPLVGWWARNTGKKIFLCAATAEGSLAVLNSRSVGATERLEMWRNEGRKAVPTTQFTRLSQAVYV